MILHHRDGHMVNVAAVPDWLEKRIGKTERQHVLHRFLAQIVVNAENLGFLEIGGQNGIQSQGGIQVIADRFLDHEARNSRSRASPAWPRYFGISANMLGGVAMDADLQHLARNALREKQSVGK